MKNIIKKYELILTEVNSNNNKFWRGILYNDGSGASEYGRVGYDAQTTEYPSHSVVEKKMKEKLKKGYTELKTVGSINENTPVNVKNVNLNTIARSEIIKNSNPTLNKLIDRLVAINVHNITSNTQITYNSSTGLFATPLGILSMEGINEGRDLLYQIAPHIKNNQYNEKLNQLVSQYLRIVPQNVGMRLNVKNLFPDDNSIQKQLSLIDSLESSYQALSTSKPQINKDNNVKNTFSVDMDVLSDQNERNRLTKWFEGSKKSMHQYNHVKVIEMFFVKIHDMHNSFNSKLGNLEEVWHGSSGANCLSILKSGLRVSPPTTAVIAGRLFGGGIYGSHCSSKSMGYTFGRWQQSRTETGFLFVCDFAMGNPYITTQYGCNRPNGYDSIWAKESPTGLKNDELIVPNDNQVNIKYLLELK